MNVTQKEIIEAAALGALEVPPFIEVLPGVEVTIDALKLEGVRVAVSMRTTQAVADLLGLMPITARVEDRVNEIAKVRLRAFTFSPVEFNISAWSTIEAHSRAIDRALADQDYDPEARLLVSTVGKSWVLDNCLTREGRAADYGWHDRKAPYHPQSGIVHVWQPLSTAHNLDHFDYSQTLRVIRVKRGTVLLSGSGEPLRVLRHPGCAVMEMADRSAISIN